MDIISFPKLGLEFELNNVAFEIGSFKVYWYGILISIGFILALVYAFTHAKKFGVDSDHMVDVIILGMIGGIVGARLYYVIFSWDLYKDDLLSIFSTRSGGLAIYGGLIGALLVGGLACKWRKVKLKPMFDLTAIGFLIGQGIGRWGNFFNIEAYGGNTSLPWGMTSPKIQAELTDKMYELAGQGMTIDPLQPVHPTFLYESLWCLLGFVLLAWYAKRRRFDGEIFLIYLGWYGIERFVVEGLRTDSLMLGPIRVSQLLAAVLVVVSVVLLVLANRKLKQNPEKVWIYANSEEWHEYLENEKNKKQKSGQESDEPIEEIASDPETFEEEIKPLEEKKDERSID